MLCPFQELLADAKKSAHDVKVRLSSVFILYLILSKLFTFKVARFLTYSYPNWSEVP